MDDHRDQLQKGRAFRLLVPRCGGGDRWAGSDAVALRYDLEPLFFPLERGRVLLMRGTLSDIQMAVTTRPSSRNTLTNISSNSLLLFSYGIFVLVQPRNERVGLVAATSRHKTILELVDVLQRMMAERRGG